MFIECLLCLWHRIGLKCTGETSGEAKEWPSPILSDSALGDLEVEESEQQEIRDWERDSWGGRRGF